MLRRESLKSIIFHETENSFLRVFSYVGLHVATTKHTIGLIRILLETGNNTVEDSWNSSFSLVLDLLVGYFRQHINWNTGFMLLKYSNCKEVMEVKGQSSKAVATQLFQIKYESLNGISVLNHCTAGELWPRGLHKNIPSVPLREAE